MAEGNIGGTPISELPESSFAYCEPGDTAVGSRCHFPIRDKSGKADAAHVRNALARLSGSQFEDKARPAVEKAAKELGIGEPASGKGSIAAGDASSGAQILADLYGLIGCEADEPDQLAVLQQAATSVARWIDMERGEIGGPGDDADDGMYPKARLPRPGRKDVEVKAEGLTTKELDAWLAGERSRRIVVVPFGGPLPGGKAGLDLDFEYFDADTDLYGPFPGLRATRERLVDWHHDDTTGVPKVAQGMKGAILGKIVLDEGPSTLRADDDNEYDGVLADFWANAGEQRIALIRDLQRRGKPIFGSSMAVAKAVRKTPDPNGGSHIDLWPLYRHTISTSPQNTFAVVPPLKAVLQADLPFGDVGLAALKAALVGLEDLGTDLRTTSRGGEDAATARRLSMAITEAEALLPRLFAKIEQSKGHHLS